MNQTQQIKWDSVRKRGMGRYLIQNALLTAVVFLALDALIGSGYTLLIKQGNWDEYIGQVNWVKLAWQGFIAGLAVGCYNWRKQEKVFGQKQS